MVLYQGENNLNECLGPNGVPDGRQAPGGGPRACGTVADASGYACAMEMLVSSWRSVGNLTPEEMPIGVVTLAAAKIDASKVGQRYMATWIGRCEDLF